MNSLYSFNDFEAIIRIFAAAEGGRNSSAFNGVRWDFGYADDPPDSGIYAIHPDFFDEDGSSLPTDKPLPIGIELPARMIIVRNEMREKVHRSRISEGTKFYCQEGGRRVAEGKVTRITGLFKEPRNKPLNG